MDFLLFHDFGFVDINVILHRRVKGLNITEF